MERVVGFSVRGGYDFGEDYFCMVNVELVDKFVVVIESFNVYEYGMGGVRRVRDVDIVGMVIVEFVG